MVTLGEIAKQLGLVVSGDSTLRIRGLAPLTEATSEHLSFVSKETYVEKLRVCQAGAVIIHPDWVDGYEGNFLFADSPYLAYARATALFDSRPSASRLVHSTATVADTAQLATDVTIDAHAVVGVGVVIEDGAWIGANVVIGDHCRIGANTRIYPGTVVYHDVHIGSNSIVHANAIIGADGFGFAPSPDGWVKILQLGGVRIGNWVEIGAGVTIDRGALSHTRIEDNVIIDDQVHVAHNVHVGRRTAIAACSAIAGSTTIGEDCTFAGMCGVGDHLTVVDNVHVNGQGRVSRSLTESGLYASGTGIAPYREWSKNAVRFEQLADMAKRVKALEKQIAALDSGQAAKQGDPS